LEEFQDVFTDVPGLTNLAEHSITLTTEEPIHSRPYSLPHSMQKEVEKELDDMLKLGIIEPSTSSYSSVVGKRPEVRLQRMPPVTITYTIQMINGYTP